MAERDRAAVGVDALRIDIERADGGERDAREGLVDLPQVDVGGRQAVAGEQALRGLGGPQVQGGVRAGDDRPADDLDQRLEPAARARPAVVTTPAAPPSESCEAFPAVIVPPAAGAARRGPPASWSAGCPRRGRARGRRPPRSPPRAVPPPSPRRPGRATGPRTRPGRRARCRAARSRRRRARSSRRPGSSSTGRRGPSHRSSAGRPSPRRRGRGRRGGRRSSSRSRRPPRRSPRPRGSCSPPAPRS